MLLPFTVSTALEWEYRMVLSKRCYVCGLTKPHHAFYRDRSQSDGHMSRCKQCDNLRNKLRPVSPQRRNTRRRISLEHQQILRDERNRIKAKGCALCGYSKCVAALEFHHLEPNGKEINLSVVNSLKQLQREASKCVVLCANCHREAHDGMHELGLLHAHKVTHDDKQINLFK